jgi:dienelactone hydrolase
MMRDLGPYSDWVEAARRPRPVEDPAGTRRRLREVLGFTGGVEQPQDVRLERTWSADGVDGQEVSWSVGYGPRTQAWVLKPAGAAGPLPGVLALHDHSAFKFSGRDKVAQGPDPAPPSVVAHWRHYYQGRAYANELARRGFVVLVHDVFTWGSRRFPLEAMPQAVRTLADATRHLWRDDGPEPAVAQYNAAAAQHELIIEKYCALLGTTFAGVVAFEDRVALNYLRSREDVGRIGCIGLSGGGNRSALLLATHDGVAAAAIICLMTTYDGLLDHHVAGHSWMLFPHGWARHGDWTDIAACRAPLPLLVQYALQDELFTPQGMRDADQRLTQTYASWPGAYTAQWYDGPHRFDLDMQQAALSWLADQLA